MISGDSSVDLPGHHWEGCPCTCVAHTPTPPRDCLPLCLCSLTPGLRKASDRASTPTMWPGRALPSEDSFKPITQPDTSGASSSHRNRTEPLLAKRPPYTGTQWQQQPQSAYPPHPPAGSGQLLSVRLHRGPAAAASSVHSDWDPGVVWGVWGGAEWLSHTSI